MPDAIITFTENSSVVTTRSAVDQLSKRPLRGLLPCYLSEIQMGIVV